jgi:hypothetical protein
LDVKKDDEHNSFILGRGHDSVLESAEVDEEEEEEEEEGGDIHTAPTFNKVY